MAGGIVWLASYPKSGSTWVRAFLAAYLADGEPLSFDRLQAVTASDSRWEDFIPVAGNPPHELSDAEVDALRPEVQRRLAKTAQPRRVVKTHNARIIAHGTPLVQPRHTRAAIYVVRNPLDIVDSLSDHAGLTVDATIALLNDARHRLDRDALMATQYIGTWHGHVASWTEHRDFPVTVVRYEDLHRDPTEQFTRVLETLGRRVDQERLARAVASSSFNELRRLEDRAIFPETSALARSGRFFRRGKPQFWHKVLSRRQAATVLEQHGEVMAKVGYAPPDLCRWRND